MKPIEIRDRYTGEVVLSGNYKDIKDCLQQNRKSNLAHLRLDEIDLKGINLRRTRCIRTDFTGSNLTKADFTGSDLTKADFSGSNSSSADFYGAHLTQSVFKNAQLYGAVFTHSHLQKADFSNTDCRHADFHRAFIDGINIKGAKIQISIFMHNVEWGELSDEMTLELMRHDAEYVGTEAMTRWVKTGECPYNNPFIRDFRFTECAELWKPGKPKYRGIELFKKLCDEKNIKWG